MANIIVCYKWVIDEADIRFSSDSSIDTSKAQGKISEYDRNAIEAGVQLGQSGNEVIALTFGGPDAKKSIKEALSRGPAKAVFVNDESAENADGFVTAEVLAAAIKKLGNYQAIICSEGASDTYARQIGPRLAALLDIPVLTSVSEVSIEESQIKAKRKIEEGLQTVTAQAPAVICVLPEINKPPIPSLKAVLAASKKSVEEWGIKDLELSDSASEPRIRVKSRREYTMERRNILIAEGAAQEKINMLVESLKKEGII
ncbi:electron transfer flavoprotein subunit beta/FixA family protein [Desulfitobacterium hafniense]|nr:electron transfer flavoprotein subunit beta [Desulfitobacterium hafniense]